MKKNSGPAAAATHSARAAKPRKHQPAKGAKRKAARQPQRQEKVTLQFVNPDGSHWLTVDLPAQLAQRIHFLSQRDEMTFEQVVIRALKIATGEREAVSGYTPAQRTMLARAARYDGKPTVEAWIRDEVKSDVLAVYTQCLNVKETRACAMWDGKEVAS